MDLRGQFLFLATAFATLAPAAHAQPTNHWRKFTRAEGLAETACSSVTIGASGNVLIRHPGTNCLSLFDGYEVNLLPAPPGSARRVFESPGGQLWAVATDGLLKFADEQWKPIPVPEIAAYFRAGRTNAPALLPVRHDRVLILLPDRLLQFSAEDPAHPQIEVLRLADPETSGAFLSLTPARDGALLLSGTRSCVKSSNPLRNLKPDDAWIQTGAIPVEVKLRTAALTNLAELTDQKILDTAVDADGALWAATPEGLFRRAPAFWETPVDAAALLATNQWRSGQGEIIDVRKTLGPAHFSARGKSPDTEVILRREWTAAFVARNGDLWLGGAKDVAWRHKDAWRVFTSTNQIGPEQVIEFVEAPDGRICCATPAKVWEFDGRDWLALRGGFDHINAFCWARDGTLWVATHAGLHRCVRGSWVQNDMVDGLPSPVVIAVREDDTGRIIAITSAGASVFQPEVDDDPPHTFIQPLNHGGETVREGSAVRLAFGGRDKWNVTTPERLLFSHRLDEREWSQFLPASEAVFADLSLGKHYFQVRAMDRNANMDASPANLEFTVVAPWYRETRLVVVLSVALVIAIFFAGLAFNRHRQLQRSYADVERQVADRTRELEVAHRELLHSQKMNALGTLAAGIAHDFNNILSIIKGSAQIIEDNPGNEEKIRTRLDRIKTVVQQGAEVVEAMLGFSRSSGQPAAQCDLNAVVEETRRLLGDRFLREVEVRFERGQNLPEISVSKDLVQQILLNFIFNAAEAMSDQKQIVLATSIAAQLPPGIRLSPVTARNFALVSVSDSGSGIAPEILPRIFEPFFTTKALSTRRGTGLGLSMVYELAKKMEAGLAVESAVGRGSKFTLILPFKADSTVASAKPEVTLQANAS